MILRAQIRPDPDDGRRDWIHVDTDAFRDGVTVIDGLTPTGWTRTCLVTGDHPAPA